jgi:DnaK suppressor protein
MPPGTGGSTAPSEALEHEGEHVMADRELTQEQLDTLRRSLEDERSRLLRVLRSPVATMASDDERTEYEETAQRATERADRLGVDERERALLSEVERALAKFAAGTYGIGEVTGERIPYERLAAVPWARDAVDA